ncbi:hypothetical protein DFJ73DRAFT_773676 [Zopfochytrium polystomum]|nr:hypothetical protein DFJ73DRAFT_773676 [Zopfochytrium polystomum]
MERDRDVHLVLRELVQRVARAYYEPTFIVILDLLAFNNMMRDEDLAKALKMPPTDLRKLCGRLRQDGLIRIHSKTDEIKEARHFRKVTKAHYYIDYKSFLNTIKYRMLKIQTMIQDEVDSQNRNRGYVCTLCEARFDQLTAISMARPSDGLFICEVCGTELVLEEGADVENDLTKRFNTERRPILDLLQLTEKMVIPDFVPIASAPAVASKKTNDVVAKEIRPHSAHNIKVELEGFKTEAKTADDTENHDSLTQDWYAKLADERAVKAADDDDEDEDFEFVEVPPHNGSANSSSSKRSWGMANGGVDRPSSVG